MTHLNDARNINSGLYPPRTNLKNGGSYYSSLHPLYSPESYWQAHTKTDGRFNSGLHPARATIAVCTHLTVAVVPAADGCDFGCCRGQGQGAVCHARGEAPRPPDGVCEGVPVVLRVVPVRVQGTVPPSGSQPPGQTVVRTWGTSVGVASHSGPPASARNNNDVLIAMITDNHLSVTIILL